MDKKTRTLTIEIAETDYWLLLAIAALETSTIEELVKDLIDCRLENSIEDSSYMKEKALAIQALLS